MVTASCPRIFEHVHGLFCGYIGRICAIGLIYGYTGMDYSVADIQGVFTDILGSFADILGSFTDI